ncbi:unnamed protein product [Clonostachys rosea f. rosea IK726]|uniref:Uncharacterized protein n=1 Tax=Clonostachys rosea f. rosea IK726 TaxID=1349383 RepID=A0ACA9UD82_BIOOC|nr:unnamed protein product [Clonostachys rosea f. rosea IK726]
MASNQNPVRIAMRDGYYNQHSGLQHAAMCSGLKLIPKLADKQHVTIVDYGCGQGSNSTKLVRQVLDSVSDGTSVEVLLEDTPLNDFSTLSKTLHAEFHQSSAERQISFFPRMIPVGFYNRIVPSQLVDLGVSWSSMNYLKTQPAFTFDPQSTPAEFAAARHKAFSSTARQDLASFMTLRASEIRKGGHLVAALGAQKPALEAKQGNSGSIPLQSALVKMVARGLLNNQELLQFALFPSHERTVEEVQEVLNLPEISKSWSIEVFEPELIVHPAWAEYQTASDAAGADQAKKEDALRNYARSAILNLVSPSG